MEEALKSISEWFANIASGSALSVVKALAFLVVGLIVIKIIYRLVKRTTIRSRKLDNAASAFISSIVNVILYLLLIVGILQILHVNTSSILAGFAAVGLAVALGLQNTLTSLTNGILIIFTKPFKQGDYIAVNGIEGTVKDIRLFNTKLTTFDNLDVIVPNSEILTSCLTNYSAMPMRRVDIVVPVPYSCDIEQVKTILNQCLNEDKRIVNIPAPFCRLTEYGASSLNFTVRAWVDSSVFWDVRFDLIEKMFNALRENKIEMPYNQMDIHVIDTAPLQIQNKKEDK